jgi:AhpD family alkylhydroperoxidase
MSSAMRTRIGKPYLFVAALAVLAGAAILPSAPSRAGDAEDTYKEIEQAMGGVPTFVKLFPKGAVAGAWAEMRDLELSDTTALPPKTKALISLAVAAQIPCEYCIWADTKTAREMGASDEEIAEAVALAGLTRHWSTFLHGMQIDFDTFKEELGGDMAAQ